MTAPRPGARRAGWAMGTLRRVRSTFRRVHVRVALTGQALVRARRMTRACPSVRIAHVGGFRDAAGPRPAEVAIAERYGSAA